MTRPLARSLIVTLPSSASLPPVHVRDGQPGSLEADCRPNLLTAFRDPVSSGALIARRILVGGTVLVGGIRYGSPRLERLWRERVSARAIIIVSHLDKSRIQTLDPISREWFEARPPSFGASASFPLRPHRLLGSRSDPAVVAVAHHVVTNNDGRRIAVKWMYGIFQEACWHEDLRPFSLSTFQRLVAERRRISEHRRSVRKHRRASSLHYERFSLARDLWPVGRAEHAASEVGDG